MPMTSEHPDPMTVQQHLAIFPPKLREDLAAELAMTQCGALGAVWLEDHDAQVWLHGGADEEERGLVLAAAHDALHDPAGWAGCWHRVDDAWLLWIYINWEAA